MRPGEKLEERLFGEGETPESQPAPRIHRVGRVGACDDSADDDLNEILEALRPICFFDPARATEYRNRWALRAILRRIYPHLLEHPDEPQY